MINYGGMIIWITGLPGAGKTTVATKVCERLKAAGAKVQLLDGDVIRELNNGRIGFSREDRITHMIQVGNTAKILKQLGIICIVALIAPYREVRRKVLQKIGAMEIFVDAPLEVCKTRDPKGLYVKAARGEIKNFTGIDDPYEPPLTPQVHLHTDLESPDESSGRVYQYLERRGLIDEQMEFMNGAYQANPLEKLVSRFPFASLLVLKKNGLTGKGAADFIDDCLQFLQVRKYPYKYKTIFIAGLPKSGTTWMRKLLSMVPGYHDRTIYDPSRSILSHDISHLVFNLLPSYSYNIIKLHTRYTPDNFATIRKHVDRFIVMYRDLRDMCLSRYYHVINEETHRHHQLYKSLPKEEALVHSINIIRTEYVKWVKDWHTIAQTYPDRILEVRYEDINADVEHTMGKVLAFFDIPIEPALLVRMAATQLKKPVDLKLSISRGDTRRKGIVGEWKREFTQEHKTLFKEIAGELLMQLGYESGGNW
jgi:adenylylsulfate kinase